MDGSGSTKVSTIKKFKKSRQMTLESSSTLLLFEETQEESSNSAVAFIILSLDVRIRTASVFLSRLNECVSK